MKKKITLDDISYCYDNRVIIYWSDSDGNGHDLEITLGKKFPKALEDALEEYLIEHKDE